MGWIEVALILLPKGMRSHRTFRLPLDLNVTEMREIKLEIDKKNCPKLTSLFGRKHL